MGEGKVSGSLERSHCSVQTDHSSSDGVEGVRGESGSGGDGPSESERGEEVTLKGSNEDNGLDRVVETYPTQEIETSAYDRP